MNLEYKSIRRDYNQYLKYGKDRGHFNPGSDYLKREESYTIRIAGEDGIKEIDGKKFLEESSRKIEESGLLVSVEKRVPEGKLKKLNALADALSRAEQEQAKKPEKQQ